MPKLFNSKYSILSFILIQNCTRLGMYRTDNLSSFCKKESETLYHFLYNCTHSNSFWKYFELYYFSLINRPVHLNLKDILGIPLPECSFIINYLILVGKVYLWSCRGNETLPSIGSYKVLKVNKIIKYKLEKYICSKHKNLDKLMEKWKM